MISLFEMQDRPLVVRDPVCGRSIDVDAVVAEESYRGWTYFFCSEACRRQFLKDREAYAGAVQEMIPRPPSEHPSNGGTNG